MLVVGFSCSVLIVKALGTCFCFCKRGFDSLGNEPEDLGRERCLLAKRETPRCLGLGALSLFFCSVHNVENDR